MYYSAICIKAYGDRSNPDLYPQIDEEGHFVLEPGDSTAIASVDFTNLLVKRNAETLFETEHGLDGKLFVTDSRVIIMCDEYESGSTVWIGNPVVTILASVASSKAARSRIAGKVLTGHIRYQWIENVVSVSEKLLFNLVDEMITIDYQDPFDTAWSLTFSLKNVKGISRRIDAEIKRRFDQFDRLRVKGKQMPGLPPAYRVALPDHRYCPQCGERIKEQDRYCKRCGTKQ